MAPVVRTGTDLPGRFEVSGIGAGNKTVDWVLGPVEGRTVLFDVKRRTIDFIKQADHIAADNRSPDGKVLPPDHDPALLFRSVEDKLLAADPDKCLQGVWIQTDIKQERTEFTKAFEALDGAKVHFALLGDWEQDVHIVVRREQDRPFLLKLFFAIESDRFTFNMP